MTFAQKVKYFLIRKITKLLIHSIIFTCNIQVEGEEIIQQLRKEGVPIIYVYWHRHIFFTIYRFKNTQARPLISLSPDGEIVAQIALEFGMDPVRGSSSKGGARAFLHLLNSVKESMAEKGHRKEILITADGPKGPLKEIKDGTILLAQKTNATIVPFSWYSSRVKIFEKSWDRFILPLPFGRIRFTYGQPFQVPAQAKKDQFPQLREQIKAELDKLEEKLEHAPHRVEEK